MPTLEVTASRRRWLIALAAVAGHLCIGSVYAYSVMSKPVATVLHVSPDRVKIAFSIAIAFLGLSAAFLGGSVQRMGPRLSMGIAAVCWGSALIGSGLAVRAGSVEGLYLCYGVLGGLGLGIGYITPVATLVRWFPDRRGLATGIAIMGFGFASMLAGPLMAASFNAGRPETPSYTVASVSNTFMIFGVGYLAVMLAASRLLINPPTRHDAPDTRNAPPHNGEDSPWQALRTRRFVLLWLVMFLSITAGISLISAASPMVQSMLALSPTEAGAVVGLLGIFNGLGRFLWSAASDYLGRPMTFVLFFVVQVPCYAVLPSIENALLFQVVLCAIISCYGGAFATGPAYVGDLFGTRSLAAIYGYLLTAWSAAGIVGPSVLIPMARSGDTTDYPRLVYACAGLLLLGLLLALLLARDAAVARRSPVRADGL